MSTFYQIIARVGMLTLIIFLISKFPWPDISNALQYLQDAVNMLMFLNPIMNMSLALQLGASVLLIELILLTRRILVTIIQFVASGSFGGGEKEIGYDTDR